MSDIPGHGKGNKIRAGRKAGKKASRITWLAIAGVTILLVICGVIYLLDGSRWYGFEFIPSSNVTMAISINSTGPQQVTILSSGSDRVSISTHSIPAPSYYLQQKSDETIVGYRLTNAYLHENAKVETFVYLPGGKNYQIVLSGKDLYNDSGKIINKYGTGNLTIQVDNR